MPSTLWKNSAIHPMRAKNRAKNRRIVPSTLLTDVELVDRLPRREVLEV